MGGLCFLGGKQLVLTKGQTTINPQTDATGYQPSSEPCLHQAPPTLVASVRAQGPWREAQAAYSRPLMGLKGSTAGKHIAENTPGKQKTK